MRPSPPMSHALAGVQLALTVLGGLYVGSRLDRMWGTSPWLLVAGAGAGVLLGLTLFLLPFLRGR